MHGVAIFLFLFLFPQYFFHFFSIRVTQVERSDARSEVALLGDMVLVDKLDHIFNVSGPSFVHMPPKNGLEGLVARPRPNPSTGSAVLAPSRSNIHPKSDDQGRYRIVY
ncbi:uncharacterized protein EI90DRAFT_3050859 [Cantharellus anzutake]|uniref:uncharacterized protein n=1 Tax=Cantharellus anzutake TaxID=1750568 RepID=UPI0019048EC1|nr:uncharacterized protein EI90DRAFT_3050859 [Cantharellus anzutake]KAF8334061.1 hypothetical protein EI90DRAFT_3050859 [Cantharellus anzutake]